MNNEKKMLYKNVLKDGKKTLELFNNSCLKVTSLQEMNLENNKVDLYTNHNMLLNIFDRLNMLLNNDLDCYYTGGAILFISNGFPLERYHTDLDLFVNEAHLFFLKKIISCDSDFKINSNMHKKGVNGHEYKISYKDYPVSVGLFLFERKKDGGIITKKYYYDLPDIKHLYVDERHFTSEYVKLVFNDNILVHNDSFYKMLSQEFIYYSKINLKSARPKDLYDIRFIEKRINIDILRSIDIEKQKKVDITHKNADNSILVGFESSLYRT